MDAPTLADALQSAAALDMSQVEELYFVDATVPLPADLNDISQRHLTRLRKDGRTLLASIVAKSAQPRLVVELKRLAAAAPAAAARRPRRERRFDIGEFIAFDPNEFLCDTTRPFATELIEACVDETAVFDICTEKPFVLDAAACDSLCAELDAAYDASKHADLKIVMTDPEARLGREAYAELNCTVGGATQFLLRRTVASGAWIPFHQDVASATVQVPLRSDTPDAGGKLVFLDRRTRQPVFATRIQGVPLFHTGSAVHGVTAFTAGVRYALYALCTDETVRY